MKIKFTTDYTPKDKSGISYEKGQVVDMSKASAEHFIRRNLAVHVLSLKDALAPIDIKNEQNNKEGKQPKKRGRPPLQR